MPQVNIYKTLLAASFTLLFITSWMQEAQAFNFRTPQRKLPGRRIGAGTRAFEPPMRVVPQPDADTEPTRGVPPAPIEAAPRPRLPGRRQGAGSRSPSDPCLPNRSTNLVALLPATNLGQTTSAYPRFFWLMPPNNAFAAEFSLYSVDAQRNNRQLLYQTSFGVTGEAGIASLDLPSTANLPPLEVNQDYRWSLALVCNPDDRSQDVTVEGWVQRVSLSAALTQQLQQADPRDRPAIYAENGLWFNTLEALAQQRCLRPKDNTLTQNWANLLKSVQLGAIANQPLLPICTPPTRP